jgi:endonuclease YncB( thermonuclease family)
MKKTLFTLLFVLFASLNSFAISYGNVEIKQIVSIYDGDTFKCNIDSYPMLIGKSIGVRIIGIDTPEMTDKRIEIKQKAIKAKIFVTQKLKNSKKIELRNMQRDKYFRILAEVYVDNQSLSQMLIKEGLAKPYDGGTKTSW